MAELNALDLKKTHSNGENAVFACVFCVPHGEYVFEHVLYLSVGLFLNATLCVVKAM